MTLFVGMFAPPVRVGLLGGICTACGCWTVRVGGMGIFWDPPALSRWILTGCCGGSWPGWIGICWPGWMRWCCCCRGIPCAVAESGVWLPEWIGVAEIVVGVWMGPCVTGMEGGGCCCCCSGRGCPGMRACAGAWPGVLGDICACCCWCCIWMF